MGQEERKNWVLIYNHLGMVKVFSIIATVFSIIANIWLIVSIVVFIAERRFKILDVFKHWLGKPVSFSYKNDDFARDTIKYRFRNIIYDINNEYENAMVKLRPNIIERIVKDNGEIVDNSVKLDNAREDWKKRVLNRPLHADSFYGGIFQKPDLFRLLPDGIISEKNVNAGKRLLSSFYKKYLAEYKENKDFIERAPFIDVEHVFYFYILDKLGSLTDDVKKEMCDNTLIEPSENQIIDNTLGVFDPYKFKKRKSIEDDINIGILAEPNKKKSSRILLGLKAINNINNGGFNTVDVLQEILEGSLDSNSYDLSQLKGMEWNETKADDEDKKGIQGVISFLLNPSDKTTRSVNYLVDNAGVEFFIDLILGYCLLKDSNLRIDRIIYHVNVLPIFVSDVIENDKDYTFKVISETIEKSKTIIDNHKQEYRNAIESLKKMFDNNEAEISSSFIWNMPTPYEDVVSQEKEGSFFTGHDLLIVKGDLNYRRLCRDMTWHYLKRLEKLTKYITCPTLVIRSFKSNLIVDYDRTKYYAHSKEDADWKTNGTYGVIAFMKKQG